MLEAGYVGKLVVSTKEKAFLRLRCSCQKWFELKSAHQEVDNFRERSGNSTKLRKAIRRNKFLALLTGNLHRCSKCTDLEDVENQIRTTMPYV
jgi:hypothetical protein